MLGRMIMLHRRASGPARPNLNHPWFAVRCCRRVRSSSPTSPNSRVPVSAEGPAEGPGCCASASCASRQTRRQPPPAQPPVRNHARVPRRASPPSRTHLSPLLLPDPTITAPAYSPAAVAAARRRSAAACAGAIDTGLPRGLACTRARRRGRRACGFCSRRAAQLRTTPPAAGHPFR